MRKRKQDGSHVPLEARVLVSIDEAAVLLSVGRSLVYDLVMRQKIHSIKVGRMRRVPVAAIRAYVERQLILNGIEG